jgi:hypothetical protein
MNILRDTCIDFFKNEDRKKDVKEMMKPIFSMIYNEIYIYIWIIAIYNVFFIFILLGMFFLLINLFQKKEYSQSIPEFRHEYPNEMIPELINAFLSEFYKKMI